MTRIAIRDDIRGLTPYQSFDRKISTRLNTNENPYPIDKELAREIGRVVSEVVLNANRYPNDDFLDLKQELLNFLSAQEGLEFGLGNIQAANGSNEIMHEILSAFGGPDQDFGERICMSFSPSYSMYPQYCRDSFTRFVEVPRDPDTFALDVARSIEQIKQTRPTVIVIANPNNPTGNFTQIDDIRSILVATQSVKASGCAEVSRPVVVLDEAYIDFRPDAQDTALTLLEDFDNLVVVRTLSKAFSFAGVRCGFAVGSLEIINALKIVRLPYNLSMITQAVVKVALKHSDKMLKRVEEIKNTRDKLQSDLRGLSYRGVDLKVIESGANFIQVGFMNENAAELPKMIHDFLLERSVQIRVVGPEGFFRVTIGTPEEVELFLKGFKEFLALGE
jgi:histidinol-phosphate aminotransferase